MYEPLPGFNRAQAAYEAMEPPESSCDCPQLFQCLVCDEATTEPHKGTHCDIEECQGEVEPIDREDSTEGALKNCPQHGWCGGCSSRWCEDCNG